MTHCGMGCTVFVIFPPNNTNQRALLMLNVRGQGIRLHELSSNTQCPHTPECTPRAQHPWLRAPLRPGAAISQWQRCCRCHHHCCCACCCRPRCPGPLAAGVRSRQALRTHRLLSCCTSCTCFARPAQEEGGALPQVVAGAPRKTWTSTGGPAA